MSALADKEVVASETTTVATPGSPALQVVAAPDRRPLPHNFQAEKAALGCALISPVKLGVLRAMLVVDDFFLPAHREIYLAMLELGDTKLDIVSLAEELRRRGMISRLENGEMYLIDVNNSVGHGENVRHYASIVKEKARLRTVITTCTETALRASGDVKADDLIAEHRSHIERVEASAERGRRRIGALIDDGLKAVENKAAHQETFVVKTGLSDFDEKFHGLIPGFILVAARPGQSKTSFVLTTMIRQGLTGVPGLFFSKEMNEQRVLERAVSFTSQVEGSRIIRGTLNPSDWNRIDRGGRQMLKDIPLEIDDRTDLTAEAVCGEIRQWVTEQHAAQPDPTKRKMLVVAVDSMSLLTLSEPGRMRTEDVTKMSRMFKNLSEKLGVVLIMIVHLNREVAKGKKPRKPNLTDLRESGALEQDADMVIFTHREPGQKGASTGPVDALLIVEKNRDGACGEAAVSWDARFMAFYDQANEP